MTQSSCILELSIFLEKVAHLDFSLFTNHSVRQNDKWVKGSLINLEWKEGVRKMSTFVHLIKCSQRRLKCPKISSRGLWMSPKVHFTAPSFVKSLIAKNISPSEKITTRYISKGILKLLAPKKPICFLWIFLEKVR